MSAYTGSAYHLEKKVFYMIINILAVGDVVGNPGLEFLKKNLNPFKKMKDIAFTVVNGENANVVGITPEQAEAILNAGADVVTLGNHTWTRYEVKPYLDETSRVIRPANFAPQCPGRGWAVYGTPYGKIAVINLIGRFSLDVNNDNPFLMADYIMQELDAEDVKIRLVDMHAEATSERVAMGIYLDGRASAVWGTHTHVQTSDSCVLDKGTGYISDLGMTGGLRSVLGIKPEQSIGKFLGDPPQRYAAATGMAKMECCIFEIDTDTGKCVGATDARLV